MKLNPDCIREIMLLAESQPLGQSLLKTNIINSLSKYTEDEIIYTCIKLNEAAYLKVRVLNYDNHIDLISIEDITYEGHQFLANVHDDKVWNHVKSSATKIGTTSLTALTDIASKTIAQLIQSQFN